MLSYSSKAVGESPFIYAIGVYFALLKAIQGFNSDYRPKFVAPMTAEKLLTFLYANIGGYKV